jgi:hypothetical protein
MSTVIQEEEESFQKLIAAVKPEDLSDPEAQTSSATDAGENYNANFLLLCICTWIRNKWSFLHRK